MTIAKLLLEHNASAVTADELQDTAARSVERDHVNSEQQDSEERQLAESPAKSKDIELISPKSLLERKNFEGETALLHAASKGCLAGA